MVVHFNPWWFSGQEHLAKEFLGQLQAILPSKHEKFKKVSDLLAEYSGVIGGVAEFALAGLPLPFAGKLAETAVQRLASKPKDVTELKRLLADALLDAKTHFDPGRVSHSCSLSVIGLDSASRLSGAGQSCGPRANPVEKVFMACKGLPFPCSRAVGLDVEAVRLPQRTLDVSPCDIVSVGHGIAQVDRFPQ